jgi:uncharacterized BrkB/YihY/UPF0761 family membrane protein
LRRRDAVLATRPNNRPLNVLLTSWEHDFRVGGGLLAGALAFRLFLWLLPAVLVGVSIAGFRPNLAGADAKSAGLGSVAASTISTAAEQANRSRWVTLGLGLFFLILASLALAKAVVIATALTWREPAPKLRRPLRAALITTAAIVVLLACLTASSWLRKHAPGAGVIVTTVLVLIWAAGWWCVSTWLLPHRTGIPWWGLLPGAVLFGVCAQIMHLVTVFYLVPRISTSSSLYGSLGGAATLLLAVYIASRMMLASATLNVATLAIYGRDQATAEASRAEATSPDPDRESSAEDESRTRESPAS